MAWVYLDDQFPQHPKVALAGGDAAWLFVAGLCYCRQYGTEGRIPKAQVPRLSDRRSPTKLAAKLAEVELWEEDGDYWQVHDWSDWNKTSNSRSEAGRKAAEARWKKQADANRNADASESHSERITDADASGCTIPIPSPSVGKPLPPDLSNAPVGSGGVMEAAAWILAYAEADRRGSQVASREGYSRSRVKPLMRDHQERWALMVIDDPEVTAQELVDALTPPPEPRPEEGTVAAQRRRMRENAERAADDPEAVPDPASELARVRAGLAREAS